MIKKTLECPTIIHEDNFTETMDGITTLLNIVKRDGNITYPPICRAIILLSHFMIENVFWNTVKELIKNNIIPQSVRDIVEDGFRRNIGIAEAIENWPEMLTGKRFNFESDEIFASLLCLIKERNEIVHNERISYYSYYLDNFHGAASAYYTAIECAKKIQKHFKKDGDYKYSYYEKLFKPPKKILFQQALNEAKKNSINILDRSQIPKNIKSLEEYETVSRKKIMQVIVDIFGENYLDLFNNSLEKCEFSIFVTEYFINATKSLPEDEKLNISKKLKPLFFTLTKKKMVSCYGVRFGEVLPHIKLRIYRIPFNNHHGYMCMPCGDHLIIFIIDTSSIVISDFMEK